MIFRPLTAALPPTPRLFTLRLHFYVFLVVRLIVFAETEPPSAYLTHDPP